MSISVITPEGHTRLTTHEGSTVLTLRLWAGRTLHVPADAIHVEHGQGVHWSHLMDGVELVNRTTYTVRTMFVARPSPLEGSTPPASGTPLRPRRASASAPLSPAPTVLGPADTPTRRPRPPSVTISSSDGDVPAPSGDSDATDKIEFHSFVVARGRGRAGFARFRKDAAAVKVMSIPRGFGVLQHVSSPLAAIVAVLGVYVARLHRLKYLLACAVRRADGTLAVSKISPCRAPAALRTATICCLEERRPVLLDDRPPIPMTDATTRLRTALTAVFEERGPTWTIFDAHGNDVEVEDEQAVPLTRHKRTTPWEDVPSEGEASESDAETDRDAPTVAVPGVGEVVAASAAWAALPGDLRDHLAPRPPAPPPPAPVAYVPSSSRQSAASTNLCYVGTVQVMAAAIRAAAMRDKEWNSDLMEAGMAIAAMLGREKRWAYHVSCVAPGPNPPPIPAAERYLVAVFHGAHWSAAVIEGNTAHCVDSFKNDQSGEQARLYLAQLGFPADLNVQYPRTRVPQQGPGVNCGPAALSFIWLLTLARGVQTKAKSVQKIIAKRLGVHPGRIIDVQDGCRYTSWRHLIQRMMMAVSTVDRPALTATHANPWVLEGVPFRPLAPLLLSPFLPSPPTTPGPAVPRVLPPIQVGATVRDVSDDSVTGVRAAED